MNSVIRFWVDALLLTSFILSANPCFASNSDLSDHDSFYSSLSSLNSAKFTPNSPDGPRRDDPGDVLDQFNVPYANNGGLAWDGEFIWGVTRQNGIRMYKINPENFEVIEDYDIDQSDVLGMTFDPVDGVLWVCEHGVNNQNSRAFLYDLEGNQVGEVPLPRIGHHGLCTDGEFMYANAENGNNNQRIFRLNREGEVLAEGPNIVALINHGRAISIEWVGQPDDGHFWVMSVNNISQLSIDFENNRAEVIQEFRHENPRYPHQGLAHDGFNLWAGGAWGNNLAYVYDDGYEETYGVLGMEQEMVEFGPIPAGDVIERTLRIENLAEEGELNVLEFSLTDLGDEPNWLEIEVEEGVVEAQELLDITFTANTEDLELGEYNRIVRLDTNDPDLRSVEIPVHLFVVEGFGLLSGTIIDARTNEAVEGATVTVDYFGFEAITDENGSYEFPDIPSWTYDLVVTMPDYLPLWAREIEVGPGAEVVQDFDLLHAQMILNPEAIDFSLDQNDESVVAISNHNGGNGPLTWSVQRAFVGGADIDPWTFRGGFNASEIVDNRRLSGIEFVGDYFYVAGGVSGADNWIYVFDREGNLDRQFPQFADSRYGFRDLAYDGELLWGIDGNVIYGFTTDGELITQFDSPLRPGRSIAWDPVREYLWVAYVTTDIVGIDREGNVHTSFERPEGTRIYGLSWFPDDPDDHNLYIFSNGGEFEQQLFKVNVETERAEFIRNFTDIEGGSAAGIAVSGLYDPYSWVVMGMIDGPDVVGIWQIAPRTDWLQIEPTEGILGADEEIELSVTLNSLGLPENENFEADLVFSHDGIGGITEVPVILRVTGENQIPNRELLLDMGWNMVSLNIEPDENGIIEMMVPLVDAELLNMMKDGTGRFYNPQFGFNNIPGWNPAEGYLIKVNEDCSILFEGDEIPWNTPIPLENGWQLVSYYPQVAVDAILALSGIVDNLLIAKSGSGMFYSPEWGFSNLGDLQELQGYQIKVEGDVELTYVIEEELALAPVGIFEKSDQENNVSRNTHFQVKNPTEQNLSLLLKTEMESDHFKIGCFSNAGLLVGSGQFDGDGNCGLAIWGDDPITEIVDGLIEGESFELHIWNGNNEVVFEEDFLNFLEGSSLTYTQDGFLAVEITGFSSVPIEFYLAQPYPNPFNNSTRIGFGLPETSDIKLSVFDTIGREVDNIRTGNLEAGHHSIAWQAEGMATGIYFIHLNIGSKLSIRKVLLIK